YGIRRFFACFFEDYASGDALTGEVDEVITVWSVSGRDQASIYNDMIRSFDQPQSAQTYGKTVGVQVQIVAADTILPSLATGNGPDVLMGAGVGQPVDFAMRHVLTDLRELVPAEELEEILSRFRESAYAPFAYRGGLYALPEQQSFLVMFYRSDILADLGIAAPSVQQPWTWDDIRDCLPTLQKNNMSILMETGANANTNGLGSFAMLLYQRGGAFYTDDLTATALDSETAVEAFRFWTDLYNRGGLPGIFNLANRFRTGESPIAIADFSLYNTLAVSAPEIQGLWEMAMVPGTRREDGTVDYSSYSSSTGVVLLADSEHKAAAWDYMKWWTSAQAQSYFGKEMESLLGASARYPTANLEAMGSLGWTAQASRVLTAQAAWAKAVPEVPGGYYLPRYINNAFRAATRETGRVDAREAILTYAQVIDDEVAQKNEEFGLNS
ncbi:MAG: ABC transporter substrate-binding protein, partial [Acutalibacteraceae bacterium]